MEREFINWLRQQLPEYPLLDVPIGDDAAVFQLSQGARCVISSDLLTDGVDFLVDEVEASRIGRKALAVNLSDMAAMAARPFTAIVSLAIPNRFGMERLKQLYTGILTLANEYSVSIAGGDTNSWEGPLAISITILGQCESTPPWRRNAARPGDAIVVSGDFGGSLQGKHFDFVPRVNEAIWVRDQFEVHAATDVSDGLAQDLTNILSESGYGAEIQLASVPISRVATSLAQQDSRRSALERALDDGEDFELILTMPPAEAIALTQHVNLPCQFTVIGRVGSGTQLIGVDAEGRRRPIQPGGFEHTF